jgi:probable rRNA maturation factor
LHLQGYDHENEVEALGMEALEAELLAQVRIANPYLLA